MPGAAASRPGRTRRTLLILLTGVALLALVVVTARVLRPGTSEPAERNGAQQQRPDADGIGGPVAKSRGVFAAHGDGTVRFTGATSTTPDGWTLLHLRLTNAGTVRAVYTVELSATFAALDHGTATVTVDGGTVAPVSIRLDTSRLAPGRYSITATLSSDLLGGGLSTDTTTLDVRR